MARWVDELPADPLPALLDADDAALVWSVRHNLLAEGGDPRSLWDLPSAAAVLRRQRPDGSWRHPGRAGGRRSQTDHDQLRYPFRWTDVVSALDAMLLTGASTEDPAVSHALAWLAELFRCMSYDDPVVRMRAADGLEKVARQRPELLEPYLEPLLAEIAAIEQPSVQWHLAQIVAEVPLSRGQRRRAVAILKRNLEHSHDWIVLNLTMESLAVLARDDPALRAWLAPVLRRHLADERKAVAKRACKLLEGFEGFEGLEKA